MANDARPLCLSCGHVMDIADSIVDGSGLRHFERQQLLCPSCGDRDSRFVFTSAHGTSCEPVVESPSVVSEPRWLYSKRDQTPNLSIASPALSVPLETQPKPQFEPLAGFDVASENVFHDENNFRSNEPGLIGDASPSQHARSDFIENPFDVENTNDTVSGASKPLLSEAAFETSDKAARQTIVEDEAESGHRFADVIQSYMAKWRQLKKFN